MGRELTLALLALVPFAAALYSSSDDVIQLTPSNFDSKVIKSDEIWFVEFYAPWCGHCKSLAPEWKKAAKALNGVVNIAAVDADAHRDLGGRFGVQGFPTIKIFGANKNSPTDFRGGRDAKSIVDSAMSEVKSLVNARLSGKSGGSGGSSGGSGSSDDVVELTESNFKKLVLDSDEPWLVEFFAPWCGHCKNLAPHWAKAASRLKGKVNLGAVDATVHQSLAGRYGVQGYPTIKFFAQGSRDAEDYDGGRTADDIVAWADGRYEENIPAPEVTQLTSQDDLKSACESSPLCIIAVLPHILDCQSECRNQYINVLKEEAERFKKQKWSWLWTEGGAQMTLEESVGIGGFGYPAMAAANAKKMKYALMKGAFSKDGIHSFLRDLSFGKGSTAPISGAKLAKVETIEPWDGKDGEYPQEEDDYSDVELDDLDSDQKIEL